MNTLLLWCKRLLIAALLLVVAAYVIFFTLQNTEKLNLDLLFIRWESVPVELLIVTTFIVGGLCGLLADVAFRLKLKRRINKLTVELSKFQ